jgi:hypothetical protein
VGPRPGPPPTTAGRGAQCHQPDYPAAGKHKLGVVPPQFCVSTNACGVRHGVITEHALARVTGVCSMSVPVQSEVKAAQHTNRGIIRCRGTKEGLRESSPGCKKRRQGLGVWHRHRSSTPVITLIPTRHGSLSGSRISTKDCQAVVDLTAHALPELRHSSCHAAALL